MYMIQPVHPIRFPPLNVLIQLFQSNHSTATPEHPILVLDNSSHPWEQDSAGIFANPYKNEPPLNSSLMTEWNSAIFYRLTPVLQA